MANKWIRVIHHEHGECWLIETDDGAKLTLWRDLKGFKLKYSKRVKRGTAVFRYGLKSGHLELAKNEALMLATRELK